MKRWIAPLAVAMAASIAVTGLGTAADARTGPISPVDALKRQLVGGGSSTAPISGFSMSSTPA
ncbi:hypothetical protein [Planobispora takensis]|uniref:hypothetical protein n=1 Tax=Planobispora takensis TaxID=1367882 RepID=UPI001944B76E|nr:hypothetical protein [Planobispora takensis]